MAWGWTAGLEHNVPESLGIKLGVKQQVKRYAKRAQCARTLRVNGWLKKSDNPYHKIYLQYLHTARYTAVLSTTHFHLTPDEVISYRSYKYGHSNNKTGTEWCTGLQVYGSTKGHFLERRYVLYWQILRVGKNTLFLLFVLLAAIASLIQNYLS